MGGISLRDSSGSDQRNIVLKGANGRAFVTNEYSGLAHNYVLDTAATTYSATENHVAFTVAQGIQQVTITVTDTTAAVSQNKDEYVRIVWDAPTTGVAGAWLGVAGFGSVEWDKVYNGQTRTFLFAGNLTAVDVLPVGFASTAHILVEAIGNA